MTDSTEWVTVHDTAYTNTTPNSCVEVRITANFLSWDIPDNMYGDKLPLIPSSSRVEHKKILYHQPIKATVKSRGGVPISGRTLSIKSDRVGDAIRVSSPTNSDGCAMVIIESREPGDLSLSVMNDDITAMPWRITLKEAWYEAGFHITHYIIADERDAHGPMAQAPGVTGRHRRDFLYGAGGVPMQGTGITLDNRYVRYDGGGSGWHNNAAGNPDILNNPSQAHLRHGRRAWSIQRRYREPLNSGRSVRRSGALPRVHQFE